MGAGPFHPLKHGYELMVDLFEDEISTLLSKGGKRAGGCMQPPAKKLRTEAPRQDWVENPNEFAKRREYGFPFRGSGGVNRGGRVAEAAAAEVGEASEEDRRQGEGPPLGYRHLS